MKTRYIVGIAILAVLLGIGWVVYRTLGNLDQYIEAGIEQFGSELIGAKISLDGVTLDLATGSAALHGLTIGNPAGFTTDYAVQLDNVSMALNVDALSADTIVVREIRVQGPAVIYELTSGGSNIDTIQSNVNSFLGDPKPEQGKDAGGKGPKLIIEDIYINDGQVSVSHSALQGKKITTPLPDIHLQDIGKGQGGATPGEVAREIMASLKSGVNTGVGSLDLDELPGAVADQLKGVTELAGSGAAAVMDKAKGAGGAVTEGLGEAGKKLKNIFDR